MTMPILAILLGVVVAVAWWRLALRQARAPVGGRARVWRMAALFVGQPALAGLLYLTLAPPPIRVPDPDMLTVVTRGGTPSAGRNILLPEATNQGGIEHAPDLATALRRHPGIRRIRIRGEGLEPRDRGALRGMAVAFDPVPLPPGLIALTLPERTAPGGAFRVSGQVLGGGSVDLLDPAGQRVATAPVDGEGYFTLDGTTRVPGVALFQLRTRDRRDTLVSAADVPLWTATEPGPRVTLLGGAPGPEVKFWRRWAGDAGLKPVVHVSVGAGLGLGDPRPPLTVGGLARVDLLILDERSWASLGAGERAAIGAAVRGGMGVLLRVTGPVPPGYGAALGLTLSGGAATAPVRLIGPDGTLLPTLTRRVGRVEAADALPLLTDASGAVLANWRAVGRGRVGAWWIGDAAGLVTSGHGDRYGAMWAGTVASLARAGGGASPRIDPLVHRGSRTALCGLEAGDLVVTPAGRRVPLLVDPATPGCAGYTPRAAGWHGLRHGGATWPFHVAAALPPGLAAAERRAATLALVRNAPDSALAPASSARPGPSWPWLIAFLALAALLWWLERARAGRPVANP